MKLLTGVLICFCYIKMMCLIPFDLKIPSLRMKSSITSIIYSIVFCVALIIIDYRVEKTFRKRWYSYNYDNYIASEIMSKGTYITMVVCVFWSIIKIDSIFKIIGTLKASFRKLKNFNLTFNYDVFIKCFLLKFFITEFSLLILHFIFYLIFYDSLTSFILNVPLVALKYMIASAFLIKYDILLTLMNSQFSHVNKIIQKKIEFKFNNKNNWDKMKFDCEMSDTIDELAKVHFQLCHVSNTFSNIFSIPMISILGYMFLVIETQFIQMLNHLNLQHKCFTVTTCIFFWSFFRISELVIVLQDGGKVIAEVIFI